MNWSTAAGITSGAAEHNYGDATNPSTGRQFLSVPQEVVWDDSLAQDRFFAYADKALIDQVKLGAEQGEFVPEHGAELFTPGRRSATSKFSLGG